MKLGTPSAARSPRRIGIVTASTLAGALTVGGFLAMVPTANAEGNFSCAELMPGLGNGAVAGFDNNTNIFVGGNFAVQESASEAEGRIVVMGNADFSKTQQTRYNVGEVGVGSQTVPTPGAEMLLVGGNVSSNGTTIDVGFRTAQGGAVRIKGANNAPAGKLITNGGALTVPDAGAVSEHTGVAAELAGSSAQFSALADTGMAVTDKWSAVLQGDGVSSPQVFTVDGGALGAQGGSVSLQLKGIPAGARVVVNVTGAPAAGLFFNSLLDAAGTPINTNANPPAESAFGAIAANLVWNFESASNVSVGGQAQVPGTILVPTPGGVTEIFAPGTNGRILVSGDLTHRGSGSEMHAYPLSEHALFGCKVPGDPVPTATASLATSSAVPATAPSTTPATAPATAPSTTTSASSTPSAAPLVTRSTTPTTVPAVVPAATASNPSTSSLASANTATAPAGKGLAVTGANTNSALLFGGAALLLLGLGVFTLTSLRRRH